MTEFGKLVQLLRAADVDFVIIGGLAATLHGAARFTQDVDIVYSRTPENIRRLANALVSIRPYLRGAPRGLPFIWDEETVRKGMNFTLTTELGDLDVLGEVVGGGRFEDLFGESTEVIAFGSPVQLVNLNTLIRLKRAAGRPKDFEALAELEALLEEKSRR